MALPNPSFTYTTRGFGGAGEDGVAGLYNLPTADRDKGVTLRVREIRWITPTPFSKYNSGQFSGVGKKRLSRVTGATGGVVVPARKMATSSSDLPAQIVCRTNLGFDQLITSGSGDLLRNTFDACQLTGTNLSGVSIVGNRNVGSTGNHIVWRTGGSVEGLRLAEGEGLAVEAVEFSIPYAFRWEIVARVVATGKTYIFISSSVSGRMPGDGLISIINGAGSGVALDILRVNVMDRGVQLAPAFGFATPGTLQPRVTLSSGYVLGTVSAVETPAAHNTGKPCPSFVKGVRGPFRPMRPAETSQFFDWFGPGPNTGFTGSANVVIQQANGVVRYGGSWMNSGILEAPFDPVGGAETFPQSAHAGGRRNSRGAEILWSTRGARELDIVLGAGEGVAVTVGIPTILDIPSQTMGDISFLFEVDRGPRSQDGVLYG